MVRKALMFLTGFGIVVLSVSSCGLLAGQQPPSGDHTTVIPITTSGGDSAAWVLVTVLVALIVAVVVYAMNERSKRQRVEDQVHIQILAARGEFPMLNGRPYVATDRSADPHPARMLER